MTEAADNSIVVGVDGSEASLAALRWAAEQASSMHADVIAVHAWEPAGARFASYAPVPVRPTAAEQRAEAARMLAAAVREVLGPRSGRSIRVVVVEGPPARVLPARASGALLLALGRSAYAQRELPALGTVGRACVRCATVPVVMVPVAPDPAAPSAAAPEAGRPARAPRPVCAG
ncbi:universal stress protein [Streptomyces hyaluromycini]|uniref:universal stress protein n=1 Tax=Streptomyces hyaluromycini TaxID=1377993 RepID=UPI00142E3FB7|nr:universal stress protein [Streptomyces hyaluromycini]